VVDLLHSLGRPAAGEELRAAGASPAILRRLVELGVLRRFVEAERLTLERHLLGRSAPAPSIVLRTDQERALDAILAALGRRRFERFLLQGMTGSGKTEVYLRAAAAALEGGRAAILLVPEIALVPALAREAQERFGAALAVLHSGLGGAERSQEWERIRRGEARVVVGPRSALFAPVGELGLVVVDEEQDGAYKQESSPRYHGRDLALVRARSAGAVALLVSATPSFEARYAAEQGSLVRLTLTERAGAGRLPQGILVDLRSEPTARPGEIPISARLASELAAVLEAGDQAILLRNRRGYSPVLLCRACGEDFRCADCGLPRTFHRRDRRLICHWCGSSLPVPAACPACGATALDPIGSGTERVEEQMRDLLPGVPIDVLDRDASRRVGGAAAILERFRRGDTRLLVGTQMLSKGHHFPNVALTVVLSADSYLSFPDFRAVEKTYSLLTQIAGRAGRGERPGRVVIQTWHPEHYAIRAALENDDATFAAQEMRFREIFGYPPVTRMVQVLSRDRDRARAAGRLAEFAARLGRVDGARELRVNGPAPAPLERLRGEWRFQLLVRGPRPGPVRAAVARALGDKPAPELVVDVDPYQLL
jgi:primosomal protein N' (replication factor Y)